MGIRHRSYINRPYKRTTLRVLKCSGKSETSAEPCPPLMKDRGPLALVTRKYEGAGLGFNSIPFMITNTPNSPVGQPAVISTLVFMVQENSNELCEASNISWTVSKILLFLNLEPTFIAGIHVSL